MSQTPNTNNENGNDINLDALSQIVNQSPTPPPAGPQTVYDINLSKMDDILLILQEKKYDFAVLEPQNEHVKIAFKLQGNVVESKYIRYPVYTQILLQTKQICALKLEETQTEQKGTAKHSLGNTPIQIIAKTVPGNLGEQIFIKISVGEAQKAQTPAKKKGMDIKTASVFLGVLFIIALILGGGFLGFIVFNAKTLQDVNLFYSLGINLNQINSFLLTTSRIVFSILVFVQTILLIIFLFKAFLTKKEFKRKKTIATILSVLLFIMTFATATFWLVVDKKINSLPNWLEMSYGNVQMYDNMLLSNPDFPKEAALITETSNLIGPVEIKFDLNYYNKEQARQGFTIDKYIWKFNNRTEEVNAPELIKYFDELGVTNISLTVVGTDRNGKSLEKVVTDVPKSISLLKNVVITEKIASNGGKIFSLDASSLTNLGTIEWYFEENSETPVYKGPIFQPSKIFTQDTLVGMIIRNGTKTDKNMDKVFLLRGNNNQINSDIVAVPTIDDDLVYEFSATGVEIGMGDGFIENFTWVIEGKETSLKAKIEDLAGSSLHTHAFTTYGPQTIRLLITDSKGQTKEVVKEVNIPKRLNLTNGIEFTVEGQPYTNFTYEEKSLDYFLTDIGIPTRIGFDVKAVRPDNLLYFVDEVKWDVDNDGDIDHTGKTYEHTINVEGSLPIQVTYVFKHRKNSSDVIEVSQRIYIESSKKEAILDLQLKADSEYAPATVKFDASQSKIKDDNIVKFIYDYGDGIVEERDAQNLGHRYLKEGTYTVTLTVVTEKGKEYKISKNLVIKPPVTQVKISSSLASAPVGQEISFSSAGTQGQISRYNWDFGDGFSSSEANPNYAYKTPGKYTVTLTLDFANNNTVSENLEIEIYEADE